MDEHDDERPCGPVRGDGSYPSDPAPGGPENGVPGPIPPSAHPAEAIDAPDLPPTLRLEAERLAARRGPSGHSVGMVEAWGRLRSTADIGGIFIRPSGHSVTNEGDKHMTDPAPQDTGEFLVVDTPNGEMAAENARLGDRVIELQRLLMDRQDRLHGLSHTMTMEVGDDWTTCTYTSCREVQTFIST